MILGRVLRNEVIADGQAGQAIFEMDDQPFAGKYLERRRWIEIAAGLLPVGRRAKDHLVIEKEKVLDRCRDRVERCPTLPRGESNFENAVLARQHDGLSELWSNCEIGFFVRILRGRNRAGACQRRQDSEDTKCQRSVATWPHRSHDFPPNRAEQRRCAVSFTTTNNVKG